MGAPHLPRPKAPGNDPGAELSLQSLDLLVIFNGSLRRGLGLGAAPGRPLRRRLRLGADNLKLDPHGPPPARGKRFR
jgi:hypothetical protein